MSTLRDVFRSMRAKARVGILIEGVGVLVAAFTVFMALSFVADRSLRLEVGYRLVLLLIVLFVLGRVLYVRLLAPLDVELDDQEMALAVERADPGMRQALISAVQFEDVLAADRRIVESRAMMGAVVAAVEQRMAAVESSRALDGGRVLRFGGLLVLGFAVPVSWAALDWETARLWAMRNLAMSTEDWPRATRMTFVGAGGDVLRVPEGDDQTIIVLADGVVPEQAFLHYRFDGGESGREAMTLTGKREFSFTLQSVLEDVVVWADGGDGLTPELPIVIVKRPRLENLEVRLSYPAYMQKSDETLTEGDVRAPRGSVLHVRITSTKPLRSADLRFGQDQRTPMVVDATRRRARGEFTPTETGALTIAVVDADRLDSVHPPKFYVRVLEDRAPKLRYRPHGIGVMVTPQAIIPGDLEVDDDYGLRAVAASWRVVGVSENAPDAERRSLDEPAAEPSWQDAEVSGLVAIDENAVEFDAPVAFDLRPLDPNSDPFAGENRVVPGQIVLLRFSARDNFGPGEPHTGRSEPVSFRVVTREKLLKDLERRQDEQRREVELILAEERTDVGELREILSPTSEDSRAARAKLRVLALARKQRALGKRVRNVADQYQQILDEMRNNRILEPGKVAEVLGQIVTPLRGLAGEDFPRSATTVVEFAASGHDDVRGLAVLSYETIIKRLDQVLDYMQELETFATLLEDLRRVLKIQNSAITETERRRDDDASSLFDPDRGDKAKPGKGEAVEPGGNKNK